jgi:hypothetical protein
MKDAFPDILADWHRWANGFKVVAGHGTSAMFAGVRSSRQWDDSSDVAEQTMHSNEMKHIDFLIMGDGKGQGGLLPEYRTALQILARNIATGIYNWNSQLLPSNVQERVELIAKAKAALLAKMG